MDDELAVERTTSAVAEYLAGGTAVTMGDTVAQVEAKLGPPREVSQRTVVNRHDPSSTDTIYDILYDGLYVQLYHARAIDRYLMIRYVVSSDRYPLAQGLGVGVDRQVVVDVLGQPDSVVGDNYIYVAEDFGEHTVMFRFDADQVREIEWLFFVE